MANNTSAPTNQGIPLNQSVQQDPLAELRQLHFPESIDTWPWAPGWYILITLITVAVGLSIYFWIKNKRASLYKRQALTRLQEIKAQQHTQPNPQQSAQALSALLKQVALVHFPREKISTLSGDAWLQFLDQLSNSQHFTQGAGTLLGNRLFKNFDGSESQELEQLFKHCEALITQLNPKKIKEIQL